MSNKTKVDSSAIDMDSSEENVLHNSGILEEHLLRVSKDMNRNAKPLNIIRGAKNEENDKRFSEFVVDNSNLFETINSYFQRRKEA